MRPSRFQRIRPIRPPIHLRDMGRDIPPPLGTGDIPQLVHPMAYWHISLESSMKQMVVPTNCRGYGGGYTGAC